MRNLVPTSGPDFQIWSQPPPPQGQDQIPNLVPPWGQDQIFKSGYVYELQMFVQKNIDELEGVYELRTFVWTTRFLCVAFLLRTRNCTLTQALCKILSVQRACQFMSAGWGEYFMAGRFSIIGSCCPFEAGMCVYMYVFEAVHPPHPLSLVTSAGSSGRQLHLSPCFPSQAHATPHTAGPPLHMLNMGRI